MGVFLLGTSITIYFCITLFCFHPHYYICVVFFLLWTYFLSFLHQLICFLNIHSHLYMCCGFLLLTYYFLPFFYINSFVFLITYPQCPKRDIFNLFCSFPLFP